MLGKFTNERTGDVVEFPYPDSIGAGVVRLNGVIVERVLYSDSGGIGVTTDGGREFSPAEFAAYVASKLVDGTYLARARRER